VAGQRGLCGGVRARVQAVLDWFEDVGRHNASWRFGCLLVKTKERRVADLLSLENHGEPPRSPWPPGNGHTIMMEGVGMPALAQNPLTGDSEFISTVAAQASDYATTLL